MRTGSRVAVLADCWPSRPARPLPLRRGLPNQLPQEDLP